jgi:hypothetical protein
MLARISLLDARSLPGLLAISIGPTPLPRMRPQPLILIPMLRSLLTSRNPKSQPRNPKPETCTPNLRPQTLDPRTPNPEPRTPNPRPQTRNRVSPRACLDTCR